MLLTNNKFSRQPRLSAEICTKNGRRAKIYRDNREKVNSLKQLTKDDTGHIIKYEQGRQPMKVTMAVSPNCLAKITVPTQNTRAVIFLCAHYSCPSPSAELSP